MITDRLYDIAERDGIIIKCGASLPLTKSVSVYSDDKYYIGIDDSVMISSAEERVHLAHELGHCETGSFYSVYSPIDNRSKFEAKANAWAIRKLITKKALLKQISERDGDISIWELAQHFNVTENFMKKAVDYYFL